MLPRLALILVLSVLFNVFPWFQAALIYIAVDRLRSRYQIAF